MDEKFIILLPIDALEMDDGITEVGDIVLRDERGVIFFDSFKDASDYIYRWDVVGEVVKVCIY